MSMKKAFALSLLISSCLAPAAEAATWNISGKFDGGGSLSGTFDFDAVTGVSNASFTTTPSPWPPFDIAKTYNSGVTQPYASEDAEMFFAADTFPFFSSLSFVLRQSCLAAAQGPCGLFFNSGVGGNYESRDTGVRYLTSGTASPVPLPAALPLLATGLGALGFMGWRRKRKQAQA